MRFFEPVKKECQAFPDIETIVPKRADDGSAGYDFFTKIDIMLEPNTGILLPSDIKVFLPKTEFLMCVVRSSIGNKYHVKLKNGTGIIDSSFYGNPTNDGNIHFPLFNYSDKGFFLPAGERIMQGIFMPFLITTNDETLHDDRNGGFGSSNR